MQELHISKEHNKSLLLYHFVCPAKYRRDIFTESVEQTLTEICKDIEARFEIRFEEIGSDINHVHFLIQSVPMYSPTMIIRTVKSIIGRELFNRHPEIKAKLRGGQLRTKGYYVNTVGMHGNFETIKSYVQKQGDDAKLKEYKQRYVNTTQKNSLFDGMVF